MTHKCTCIRDNSPSARSSSTVRVIAFADASDKTLKELSVSVDGFRYSISLQNLQRLEKLPQ